MRVWQWHQYKFKLWQTWHAKLKFINSITRNGNDFVKQQTGRCLNDCDILLPQGCRHCLLLLLLLLLEQNINNFENMLRPCQFQKSKSENIFCGARYLCTFGSAFSSFSRESLSDIDFGVSGYSSIIFSSSPFLWAANNPVNKIYVC